jgi:AGCS family alanine or glycine:cation symporter
MQIFHCICMLVVFLGAIAPMDACWALADITMGLMTFINLPCCFLMSGTVSKALKDYECKKREGRNPVFKAREIGIEDSQLGCWK